MTKMIIKQGASFQDVIRWETDQWQYKAITGITKAAPAVVTAAGHGLTDGWRAAIVSVKGMREINSEVDDNGVPETFNPITYIDANSISVNEINAAEFSTYTSGGYLQFRAPHDLASYTARMKIKDRIGGTELLSLTTENGRITIDAAAKTITRTITAADTALITWKTGVYDLELVSPGGIVTAIDSGTVSIQQEITT